MNTLLGVKENIINSYIYELQNIPVYGGVCVGRAQYFDEISFTGLIKQAFLDVNKKLETHYRIEDIEKIPDFIITPIEMQTAIKALTCVLIDIEKGHSKIFNLLGYNEEASNKAKEAFTHVKQQYETAYASLIDSAKKQVIDKICKIEVPEVEEDEILVVRVGNENRPASQEDIDTVLQNLEFAKNTTKNGEKVTLVTHHAINFVKVKKQNLDPPYVEGI